MAGKTSRPAANNLRAWRTDRGITQGELADRASTTVSIISDLEGGKINLSDKWLGRLADALNVHLAAGKVRATRGRILDHTPESLRGDIFAEADQVPQDRQDEAVRFLRFLRQR